MACDSESAVHAVPEKIVSCQVFLHTRVWVRNTYAHTAKAGAGDVELSRCHYVKASLSRGRGPVGVCVCGRKRTIASNVQSKP